MTNEELILQKIEKIEAQLEPIVKSREALLEMKEDLIPLSNTAVHLFIEELQEIEAGFTLEDLLHLFKHGARSIRNFVWMIKMLDNMIEFATDVEPLLKSAVPLAIEHLDQLERRGVFRIIKAMMDVRAKVADAYTPEDVDMIGDGAVALLRVLKKFSDPKALAFLEKMADLPAQVNLQNAQKAGFFRMAAAGFDGEVKEGLGVMLELTKAMAKLKTNGQALQPSNADPH
ncbi:MAG: hypothetical protein PVH30_00830 [Desulfobacterales bacterium]|jgi:uncharacterized protein YjgD (DUF1641 family)